MVISQATPCCPVAADCRRPSNRRRDAVRRSPDRQPPTRLPSTVRRPAKAAELASPALIVRQAIAQSRRPTSGTVIHARRNRKTPANRLFGRTFEAGNGTLHTLTFQMKLQRALSGVAEPPTPARQRLEFDRVIQLLIDAAGPPDSDLAAPHRNPPRFTGSRPRTGPVESARGRTPAGTPDGTPTACCRTIPRWPRGISNTLGVDSTRTCCVAAMPRDAVTRTPPTWRRADALAAMRSERTVHRLLQRHRQRSALIEPNCLSSINWPAPGDRSPSRPVDLQIVPLGRSMCI